MKKHVSWVVAIGIFALFSLPLLMWLNQPRNAASLLPEREHITIFRIHDSSFGISTTLDPAQIEAFYNSMAKCRVYPQGEREEGRPYQTHFYHFFLEALTPDGTKTWVEVQLDDSGGLYIEKEKYKLTDESEEVQALIESFFEQG